MTLIKRPVGRPRSDGKPQISKLAVFPVAASLIAKYGYSGTSLRKIAKVLDVKAPSILNLFQTKERLLIELVHFVAKVSLEFHSELQAKQLPPDVCLYKMILEEVAAVSGANKAIAAIFYLPELRLANFSEAQAERQKMIQYYQSVLKEGVKSNMFRAVNVNLMAEQIFQLSETTIIALDSTKLGKPRSQAKNTADFVMRGLLADPSRVEQVSVKALGINLTMC